MKENFHILCTSSKFYLMRKIQQFKDEPSNDKHTYDSYE